MTDQDQACLYGIDDIRTVIDILRAMEGAPDDDGRNRLFAESKAGIAAGLLEELIGWREGASRRHAGTSRAIVEGFDEDSMQGAFADALNKAARFFTADQDVSLTVLGLVRLPRGGHHATVEVDMTPLSLRLKEQPPGLDVESRRVHDKNFRAFRHEEDTHMKRLVHDHFLEINGTDAHVPDFFLIKFEDADVMNHMIEHDFFKAGHAPPEPVPAAAPSPAAVVRVLRREK